jgi:MFS family permease
MDSSRMSPEERRAGASLASLFGLRMLGLFFILPLLSVEAHKLAGGENLTLVGLALGAYGLTQAVMQIPFGMASDRWGRKPVIVVGLLLFAAGSVLAGAAHSIYTVIAGRVVQGAGAISSVVVALAADLTREQQRTKAMAMIGSTIGLAFALSLVIAPVLYRWIGLSGVFYVTAGFSLIAIWLLFSAVPKAPRPTHAEPPVRARDLPALLKQPELVRLNVGIFALHVSQMSMFVVVPPMLVEAGLPLPAHWKFYLPVVLASDGACGVLCRPTQPSQDRAARHGAAARAGRAGARRRTGPDHAARRTDARFLRRLQRARGAATLARVAYRPGARARHGDRGL